MVDFDDLHGAADRLTAATASLSDPRDAEIAQQYIAELREQASTGRRIGMAKLSQIPGQRRTEGRLLINAMISVAR